MKVLVIGSGGREHSICWAISKSPNCGELYCMPGNAGISAIAECVDIDIENFEEIVLFCQTEKIDLVVVGPEVPLVNGIVDDLVINGLNVFGPSKAASILEGSKAFMKDFFIRHNIPTAKHLTFNKYQEAINCLKTQKFPLVIKTSGLAAGKGVTICQNQEQAIQSLKKLMNEKIFGAAGEEVIIEEFLSGEEVSFFALVDGKVAIPLASAQDHKTAHDGDTGPNTGGMGAYSPAPVMTKEIEKEVMEKIIQPTIEGMAKEGRLYKGILYAGLMLKNNQPKVLEFNVRFGDPECQVLMTRLNTDILDLFHATSKGKLEGIKIKWDEKSALVVIMAANGYPGAYRKGTEIKGLDLASALRDICIFHSGTKILDDMIVSDGGRVLGVTAVGQSISEAKERAYDAINLIEWEDGFYRNDIGWRAISKKNY